MRSTRTTQTLPPPHTQTFTCNLIALSEGRPLSLPLSSSPPPTPHLPRTPALGEICQTEGAVPVCIKGGGQSRSHCLQVSMDSRTG